MIWREDGKATDQQNFFHIDKRSARRTNMPPTTKTTL